MKHVTLSQGSKQKASVNWRQVIVHWLCMYFMFHNKKQSFHINTLHSTLHSFIQKSFIVVHQTTSCWRVGMTLSISRLPEHHGTQQQVLNKH